LENRYIRHRDDAQGIQVALEAIGFKILAAQECRAATLLVAIYPDGVNDEEFRGILTEEGVVTAAGLAGCAGKSFGCSYSHLPGNEKYFGQDYRIDLIL